MALTQLVLALDAIARLDRELTMVLGHADVIVGVHDGAAVEDLRRSIRDAQDAVAEVRRRATANAVAMDLETRAAMLQVRSTVVLSELGALRAAERELRPGDLGPRFATVLELQRYLVDRLAAVLARCFAARDEVDHAARWLALDQAERGLVAMSADTTVSRALGTGCTSPSARFAFACRMLLLALGMACDGIPPLLEAP